MQYAKLMRPNFPNNCLTVDIASVTENIKGIEQIQFDFFNVSDHQVEVEFFSDDKLWK